MGLEAPEPQTNFACVPSVHRASMRRVGLILGIPEWSQVSAAPYQNRTSSTVWNRFCLCVALLTRRSRWCGLGRLLSDLAGSIGGDERC